MRSREHGSTLIPDNLLVVEKPNPEQSIENLKFEIPYYKPEDLQLKYAKKFMAAMQENMAKAKEELAELEKGGAPEKKD